MLSRNPTQVEFALVGVQVMKHQERKKETNMGMNTGGGQTPNTQQLSVPRRMCFCVSERDETIFLNTQERRGVHRESRRITDAVTAQATESKSLRSERYIGLAYFA